jgi:hypothetical protein
VKKYQVWAPKRVNGNLQIIEAETSFAARKKYAAANDVQLSDCCARVHVTEETGE